MHTRRDTFIFLKFLALNEYRDSHTNTSSSEKPCTSTQQVRATFTEVYYSRIQAHIMNVQESILVSYLRFIFGVVSDEHDMTPSMHI